MVSDKPQEEAAGGHDDPAGGAQQPAVLRAGLHQGTVHHFSVWMLAATAGDADGYSHFPCVVAEKNICPLYNARHLPVYVALVDMLPELTSAHSHPSFVDEKQDKKVEA